MEKSGLHSFLRHKAKRAVTAIPSLRRIWKNKLIAIIKDEERAISEKIYLVARGAQENGAPTPRPRNSGLVNINTATKGAGGAPGISPAYSKNHDYRETNGYFSSIQELQEVSGIGPNV